MPTGVIHIDTALSNLSIAYKNGAAIARQVLPPFPSAKKSNIVYKYGSELFLSQDDLRASGAEAKDSTWKVGTVKYACSGHALKDKCPRDNENNADPALDLMRDTTTVLSNKIAVNEEVATVAALVAGITGGYVQDQAATPWNSPDVDPYKMLKTWIDAVNLACGSKPNSLTLSGPVWTAVRVNPNVVGLVTGAPAITNAGVSTAQFAELLELDEVLVGRMVYNTAPGAANQWIWGQKALLQYKDPNPGLRTLSLGYTPVWTDALAAVSGLDKVPGMAGQGDQFVQTYFWEPEIADYVVVHSYYDKEIWAPECGILFTGCLGTANA